MSVSDPGPREQGAPNRYVGDPTYYFGIIFLKTA